MVTGTLSSKFTWLYKYATLPLSIIFIIGWIIRGTGILQGGWVSWTFLALLAIPLIGGHGIIALRIKWVSVRDGSVYVKGTGGSMVIAPGQLLAAELVPLMRPFIVRLRYLSHEGGEKTIWFMPKTTWPGRPIIDENLLSDLNALITRRPVSAA